jgi:ABC-type nitrate/sulfonate/bicarbonate transport system permease component
LAENLAPPAPAARRAAQRPLVGRAWVGRLGRVLVPVVSILVALGLWELISQTGVIAERDLPAMSDVVQQLWTMMTTSGAGALSITGTSHGFWEDFAYTVRGWALGLTIATVLAVPLGIALGTSDFAASALRVPIEFLRPIPSAVLIPLLYLTIGINLRSEVFLAAFGAFWPLLVQTMYGVRDVDPVAIDTARSFGVGRFERLYRITLPSSIPYIATGLRIASTVALILAFTAELFMGTPGLGQEMQVAQSYGLTTQLFALALATGCLGVLIHIVFTRVERRALRWHPSQRVAEATT